MSSDTCLSSFVARLLVLAPRFLGSLRCVAQNPRILFMMNLIQRIHCSHACTTFFSLPCYFLIVNRCIAHCQFNRVQVQALPTEQAAPVLTDSFSRGYDLYTHACKAVGRTSLSVIIIMESNGARGLQTVSGYGTRRAAKREYLKGNCAL